MIMEIGIYDRNDKTGQDQQTGEDTETSAEPFPGGCFRLIISAII